MAVGGRVTCRRRIGVVVEPGRGGGVLFHPVELTLDDGGRIAHTMRPMQLCDP